MVSAGCARSVTPTPPPHATSDGSRLDVAADRRPRRSWRPTTLARGLCRPRPVPHPPMRGSRSCTRGGPRRRTPFPPPPPRSSECATGPAGNDAAATEAPRPAILASTARGDINSQGRHPGPTPPSPPPYLGREAARKRLPSRTCLASSHIGHAGGGTNIRSPDTSRATSASSLHDTTSRRAIGSSSAANESR